jgi:cell division protein ZapA
LVKSALEVTIAGQRYLLRGEEGEERLRAVAHLVAETFERVRQAGRGMSADRLAILAAVNLADQLLRERETWGVTSDAIRQRAERLIVCLRSLAPIAAAADEQRAAARGGGEAESLLDAGLSTGPFSPGNV